MPLDLLGPASAVASTLTRPAESRTFGAADTWFKPCSSPNLRDGTQLQAVFTNLILAQFRAIVRASGVTDENADDITLRAIRKLIADYGLQPGSAALLNPDHLLIKCQTNVSNPLQTLTTAWKTWALNFVAQTNFTGWSLDPSTSVTPYAITLPAGIWDIFGVGMGLNAGSFNCRIASCNNDGSNVVSLDEGLDTDSYPGGADAVNVPSIIASIITLSAPTKILFQQRKYSTSESGTSYMGDNSAAVLNFNALIRCSRRKGSL